MHSAVAGQVAGDRPLDADGARMRRLLDGALALVTAVAASVLVIHRLDISAWFDEAYSYGMSTQPLGSYLSRWLWGSESNMVLYYLGLRGWLGGLSLAGLAPVEVLLRLPSAVFAVAATVMVFLLGRRLFGRLAGLIAAALYATNFLQMILAQNARAYSLQLFLLAVSWWCLFEALESSARRKWLAYGAAVVLSIYADLFSGLVVVAQVLALMLLASMPGPWKTRVRSQTRPIAITLAVSFLVVLPLGVDSVIHGGPIWVPPASLHDLRMFLFTLSGDSRAYELVAFALGALGVLAAVAAYSRRWSRFGLPSMDHLGPALAVGLWFAVPVALSFAFTQPSINLHLFFTRYLVVVVPPMCLLVGLGVAALRVQVLQALAAAALAVVAWPPLALYYHDAQVQNFKDPVLWLEQRYQSGDGIVCEPDVQCGIPIAYYFAAYPGRAILDSKSPGYFSWEGNEAVGVTVANVKSYESQHSRIFLIYAPLGRPAPTDAMAEELQRELVADGYRVIDQTTAHATSADTSVVLLEKG